MASTPRALSPDEVARVRARARGRPFASYLIAAGRRLAGFRDRSGRLLSARDRLPSLEHHLLLRTARERQWPMDTAAAEYVDDLRRAIAHPVARIFTYRLRGESYAGFLAPNDFTPPAEGREPYVFVAYSASYGVLRTGYQASSLRDALRGDALENVREHSP